MEISQIQMTKLTAKKKEIAARRTKKESEYKETKMMKPKKLGIKEKDIDPLKTEL